MHLTCMLSVSPLNEEEPRYKTKTFVPQNDKWRQNLKGYLTAIGLCLAITLFSRTFCWSVR